MWQNCSRNTLPRGAELSGLGPDQKEGRMKRKKSAVSSGKTSQPLKPCQLMCATCGGLYKILSLALSSVQLAISLYFGLFLYTNVHFIDRDTRSLLATHNQTLHIYSSITIYFHSILLSHSHFSSIWVSLFVVAGLMLAIPKALSLLLGNLNELY